MILRPPLNKQHLLFLLILLTACGKQANALQVETSSPAAMPPASTSTPAQLVTIIPTPLPTQPTIPIITPDAIQVERWKEYQAELARVILAANPEIGNDPEIYKTALCEWDILGQSGQEVYVYGVCVGVTAKGNRNMRKLAIIYLEPDGSIQNVKIPEPKGPNSEMFNYDPFPKDVQEKFCYYFDPFPSDLPQCPYPYLSGSPRPRLDEMYAHIKFRKEHPEEPPLVVLSVMTTRTPTP